MILAADCCYHDDGEEGECNEAFLATVTHLLREGKGACVHVCKYVSGIGGLCVCWLVVHAARGEGPLGCYT